MLFGFFVMKLCNGFLQCFLRLRLLTTIGFMYVLLQVQNRVCLFVRAAAFFLFFGMISKICAYDFGAILMSIFWTLSQALWETKNCVLLFFFYWVYNSVTGNRYKKSVCIYIEFQCLEAGAFFSSTIVAWFLFFFFFFTKQSVRLYSLQLTVIRVRQGKKSKRWEKNVKKTLFGTMYSETLHI